MTARFRSPASLALAAALVAVAGLSRPAGAQDTTRTTPAPAAAAKEPTLTAAQRQAYVGTYAFTRSDGRAMSLRIYEQDGALFGEPTGQEAKRLVSLGSDAFHPDGMPDFRLSFTLADGRATKVTIRRGDGSVIEAAVVPPGGAGRP